MRINQFFLIAVVPLLLMNPLAMAQNAGDPVCGAEREVEQGLLSPEIYNKLNEVFELLGEEQYSEVYEELTDIRDRRMTNFEKASVEQIMGFASSQLERYDRAIEHMQAAIELDVMPNSQHFEMILQVAQLYNALERYEDALDQLDYWFCVSTEAAQKQAEVWVLKSSLHIQREEFQIALDAINRAIEISDDPEEAWYRVKLGMHLQLEQYAPAVETLKILIALDSTRKDYWIQLSGSYLELGDQVESLAALRLAYRQDLLDRGSEFIQLAGMLQSQGSPRQAAEVLQEGLERGLVEETSRNWEMTAGAWYEAKELDQSLAAYDNAGNLADVGRIDFQRASILADMENWPEVITAANRALEKGGLSQVQIGNAYLLLGMAHFNLDDFNAAEQVFNRAMEYRSVQSSAQQWLNHISETRNRIARR